MTLTILLTVLEDIGIALAVVVGMALALGLLVLLFCLINSATVADPRVEFYERMSREDILNGGKRHGEDARGSS